MIAPDHSKSAQPEERKAPAVRLEESLRDLVQEEMGVVRAEADKPIPSRSDGFWLFLCVADAALIIWLLPDAVLGDKRLELLSKVFTWLGGSLFVLGYVWFRERFLAFVRHRAWKITLVALPAVVVPSYITQVPIFFVKPEVGPPNAEIEMKGRLVHITGIRLSLQSHEGVVRVKVEGNPNPYERKFVLTSSDVWGTWWRDEQPYWALTFDVPLTFVDEAPETIELVLKEGRLDREFRNSTPKLTFKNANGETAEKAGMWMEKNRITFSIPNNPQPLSGAGVTLPYGRYLLTASYPDKQGCEKTATTSFMAKPGVESAESDLIPVERKCGDKT